jgi:hypothetical protein
VAAAATRAAARAGAAARVAAAAAVTEHAVQQLKAKSLGTNGEAEYQRSKKRGPIH